MRFSDGIFHVSIRLDWEKACGVCFSCQTYLLHRRKTIFCTHSGDSVCIASVSSEKLLAKRIVWKEKRNDHFAFSFQSEEEKITEESPFINCMTSSSNLPLREIWTGFTRKEKKCGKKVEKETSNVVLWNFLP